MNQRFTNKNCHLLDVRNTIIIQFYKLITFGSETAIYFINTKLTDRKIQSIRKINLIYDNLMKHLYIFTSIFIQN